MIAHLNGTLLFKQPNTVVVDVSGVGYEVSIPLSTFYELADAGSNVQLRIYTHVKEDVLQLYGFQTARERELFVNFISVSGIGPKIGIALLSSGMSADELIAAIKNNNLARLTLIPGVGRKTAERLIVDLRDKMTALSASQGAEDAVAALESATPSSEDDVRSQALSGLLNLGYQKSAAEKAIDSALSEDGEATVESVLRRGLRKLARL
ncbi:MAG TPA: Holliday junction branch migration protein RuvA [Pyrinomonadaceae bacterium]|jgi:Holliday junction DNA helicase RuvA|nr:Holliday junction branch migration protein RuvA [Pyrinomonadaceae bacterium]